MFNFFIIINGLKIALNPRLRMDCASQCAAPNKTAQPSARDVHITRRELVLQQPMDEDIATTDLTEKNALIGII
jgi:hypothetical protein